MSNQPQATHPNAKRQWPGYRAVWRWHFYAGLFCIPFVLLLSVTGAIYLFKPQVEAALDAPYDNLSVTGHDTSAAAQVHAAIAAVPGARLIAYELPTAAVAAVRVIVDRGGDPVRVYIHPETLQVLHIVRERDRFMQIVRTIHGELLLGKRGSMLVELAASWAIVMIVTGLYLWWPRQVAGLAGIVYPRLRRGQRLFWRDLHAVTGLWFSGFALFLLLTGLPWANVWGDYFKEVRRLTGTAVIKQDWANAHAEHSVGHVHGATPGVDSTVPQNYAALDAIVTTVQPLVLSAPVLITPPAASGGDWTAKSDTQNRPQRVSLTLDNIGTIVRRENFSDRHMIDRVIGVGVAAHEGQLFGWFNQLLGLLTAIALILLSASAVVLWWRRRAQGVLGAPSVLPAARYAPGLFVVIVLLGIYLPLFGASLLIVLAAEKFVLSRIAPLCNWLGLSPA